MNVHTDSSAAAPSRILEYSPNLLYEWRGRVHVFVALRKQNPFASYTSEYLILKY